MVNIQNFIDKRYSTRNLSDEQFLEILPDLAQQLEQYNFVTTHPVKDLLQDWHKLCGWTTNGNYINSTSRLGMKLCEHFFPNFYDIETNTGQSFRKLWTKDNLIKILKWNRKSHSTPYISEIKRGIYFCCGLPKSTMYRPQLMKLACQLYGAKSVLDPCAGWGGRMLGAVAAGCDYWAFEPNTVTHQYLLQLAKFLNIQDKVNIFCDDARNMYQYAIPRVDLVLTSPPYFDLEVYCNEPTQSVTSCNNYDTWVENFLEPVIYKCLTRLKEDGHSCWNVGKVKNRDMAVDVKNCHQKYNYNRVDVLSVISSKRQTNQSSEKNLKNRDDTVVYKHLG